MVKIGVLGGIGPEATGEFYNKLIHGLQKRGFIKENKDFPQIIINSIPAPELINEKISDKELKPYIDGLKELDGLGVDFLVMVCNTIHLYYDEFQEMVETPIIDLRKELEFILEKNKIKSALVIGSKLTIKEGLYNFPNIKIFEPNKEEINKLASSIFNFNKGKHNQVSQVNKICKKYLEKGAETIILGCTEFSVMLANESIPKINTIDVLVDAVIRKFSSS